MARLFVVQRSPFIGRIDQARSETTNEHRTMNGERFLRLGFFTTERPKPREKPADELV
jgi:hypothetical protein